MVEWMDSPLRRQLDDAMAIERERMYAIRRALGDPTVPEPEVERTPAEIWDYWISKWRSTIMDKKPVVIIISGDTGSGKSALAMQISHALYPEWTISYMVWETVDLLKMWKTLKFGCPVVGDEFIDLGFGREAMTVENREGYKTLNKVRIKGIPLLMLLPDIHDLDPGFRARAARWWIDCDEEIKGQAVVHERPRNRRNYRNRIPDSLGFYRNQWSYPLTWTNPDGTPEWEAYEPLKLSHLDVSIQDSIDTVEAKHGKGSSREEMREERRLRIIRLKEKGLTHREIREVEGCGSDEIARALRRES